MAAQLIPHQRAEFLNNLRRDSTLAICNLTFQSVNIDCDCALLRCDVGNFSSDLGIVGGVKPGANQLNDVGAFAI
ncbi:hypothetical protein AOA14_03840 [Sphingopyxis terrae subsp. terrae NBRC 15098]|uniref:Uncharacterized protein n=1 Tax=Sphingopyxis terrae subsp. terrae NBRC 15098 TaxID=1219058 RepID=A0A142VWT7_9SPHN|nr:hypothetical protein AOA14_03840 [Sphingopyxis terrae subsp. terrae NBRC 15098]